VNTTVNTGEGEVHFVTDEDGYRINANSRSVSRQYARAILTIGDSFLEALQVENEFTMPQLVARSLEQKTGLSVRVDNAGVGSWNPNHYYLMAQEALKKRKYDLGIVFITIHNDIVNVETETFQPRDPVARHDLKIPKSFTRRALIDALLYPVNDLLETRSHLFVLFKTKSRVQLARLGLTAYTFPNVFDRKEENSPMWEITSHICEKIENEFGAYGTPVFFVFLPPVYQVQQDMYEEYIRSFSIAAESVDLELPNKILKREFEKRGLAFADPLESMREKARKGIKMYGLIDRHFSKAGHEAVAEFIQPMVESYIRGGG
jgi:lysophospholipase L1-like esterase